MSESPPSPTAAARPPRSGRNEWIAGLLTYGSTAIIFLPLSRFLVTRTIEQEQLLHSFLVLLIAGGFLVYERRMRLRPVWRFGRWSLGFLGASYATLAGVLLTGSPLLMIPAFCLAAASAAFFVLGEQGKRLIAAVVAAFALFQAFALVLPLVDWPLRGLAGQLSAIGLQAIGQDAELMLYERFEEPMLMLIRGGQEFHVAPECNGFGVIASSFLLALLLVIYRGIPVWTKLSAFVAAGAFGLLFNGIRIVIIVLLAPVVGMDHYALMHEIVGVIIYYAALLAVWWMIQRIPMWTDYGPPEP